MSLARNQRPLDDVFGSLVPAMTSSPSIYRKGSRQSLGKSPIKQKKQ